jgi:hypothetical protein
MYIRKHQAIKLPKKRTTKECKANFDSYCLFLFLKDISDAFFNSMNPLADSVADGQAGN